MAVDEAGLATGPVYYEGKLVDCVLVRDMEAGQFKDESREGAACRQSEEHGSGEHALRWGQTETILRTEKATYEPHELT